MWQTEAQSPAQGISHAGRCAVAKERGRGTWRSWKQSQLLLLPLSPQPQSKTWIPRAYPAQHGISTLHNDHTHTGGHGSRSETARPRGRGSNNNTVRPTARCEPANMPHPSSTTPVAMGAACLRGSSHKCRRVSCRYRCRCWLFSFLFLSVSSCLLWSTRAQPGFLIVHIIFQIIILMMKNIVPD